MVDNLSESVRKRNLQTQRKRLRKKRSEACGRKKRRPAGRGEQTEGTTRSGGVGQGREGHCSDRLPVKVTGFLHVVQWDTVEKDTSDEGKTINYSTWSLRVRCRAVRLDVRWAGSCRQNEAPPASACFYIDKGKGKCKCR